MLQTQAALTVNLTTGVLTPSDPISARKALAITLSGTQSLTAGNMRAALYRLNEDGVSGTLVATCSTFTGPADAFVGSMSLNTYEVIKSFLDIGDVREYQTLRFDLLIYDASQAIYMVWDHINVAYEFALAGATPGNVSPITSGTEAWGNFKLISGTIHLQSTSDGEFYPLTAAGSDATIHPVMGETGIP